MRISDWSSDVCSSDLLGGVNLAATSSDISSILIDLSQRDAMNSSADFARLLGREAQPLVPLKPSFHRMASLMVLKAPDMPSVLFETGYIPNAAHAAFLNSRSEEHTSELPSLMRTSDADFCVKKKIPTNAPP